MTQPNDGGPAFPCGPSGMSISYDDGRTEHQYPGSPGMSLRDWFAGKALEGQAHRFDHPHNHRELLAKDCYEIADAMLRARSANV